jgi:hypothetical protein
MGIMTKDIERIYGRFATRCVRKPRSWWQAHKLPIWLIFPDYPIYKHEKQSLREVTINDGLHYHGVGLLHRQPRLQGDFPDHLTDWQNLYVRPDYPLKRIHAEGIKRDADYVVDYLTKWTRRGRFSPADFLILPRSVTELSAP